MSFRILGAAALVGLLTGVAAAQTKPAAPAAAPQAGAPPASAAALLAEKQPDWRKVCAEDPQLKKQVCQTTRALIAKTGQIVVSVEIREEKDGKRLLIAALPPGLSLQPGIRLVVDRQPPSLGKFTVCLPQVCLAEVPATDALIGQMKKGTTLTVQALSVQQRGATFPFQLAGFGKAFDGPPVDPKVIAQEQDDLRKRLQAEVDKRRAAGSGGQPPADAAPPADAPAQDAPADPAQ